MSHRLELFQYKIIEVNPSTVPRRETYINSFYDTLCVTQHSDKKPLEGYDKDSERVHRWLPIEFINEKVKLRNHAERLSAIKKSE